MRLTTGILVLGIATVAGLLVFVVLVRSQVDTESMTEAGAGRAFAEVERRFPAAEPWLRRDRDGTFVRTPGVSRTEPDRGGKPNRLKFLSYRADSGSLTRGEVPFWFLRLKGPALRLLSRGSDLDLHALGLGVDELVQRGPGIVLDETRRNGDRWILWTE